MTSTKEEQDRQVPSSIGDVNYEAFHLAQQVGMPLSEAQILLQLYGGAASRDRKPPDKQPD